MQYGPSEKPHPGVLKVAGWLAACCMLWSPLPTLADFFELGDAADFSVLGLGRPSPDSVGGDGRLDFANATVTGDVGVGAHGTFDFEGPAVIDGDLYLDPLIKNYNTDAGTVLGTIFTTVDLSSAVTDALDAAATYEAMLPDQTFSKIESTTVIYGNGGTNVVEIQSIELEGVESLRLVGGPDDVWILNVLGGFDLMNASWISAVPPGDVLINLVGDGGGSAVTTSTGSVINGTLLGAYRKIFPQGRSGPIIGGRSDEISLGSGGEVQADAFPVFPEPYDMTGDGKADLVLRNTDTGYVFMWEMDGNLRTYHGIGPLDLHVDIVDFGDLNGDGKVDIVLRNMTTGFVFMWEMDGSHRSYYGIGGLDLTRHIVGIGDLTGDGMADIVLRNTDTGFVYMWEMDGNSHTYHAIGTLGLNVEIVGVADLTGDGMSDVILRNTVTGFVYMWEMDGNLRTYHGIGPLGLHVDIVDFGDLNGDGKVDIVLRNMTTGFVFMWEMDGSHRSYYGIGGLDLTRHIVRVADLDDDDKADIVLRNGVNGFVFMWKMDGNLRTYYPIGSLNLIKEFQPPAEAVSPPAVIATDDLVPFAYSDRSKIVDVLVNDIPTGAVYVVPGSIASPAYGVATLLPDDTIEYKHNSYANESIGLNVYTAHCDGCHSVTGFTGIDTFSYSASDGVTSDAATVTVKVKSFDTVAESATDLSGYQMTQCADITFAHATCRGLSDADIEALGRFLGEVFP
jgi:hypothetical protein